MREKFFDLDALAVFVNRSRRTIPKLVAHGILPEPDGVIVDDLRSLTDRGEIWRANTVLGALADLNPAQAAIVPAADTAARELEKFRCYACPAYSSGHIGLARPVLLGLKAHGTVTVFVVDGVVTDGRLGTEPGFAGGGGLIDAIKVDRGVDSANPDAALTVFKLGDRAGSFTHEAALKQGRIVRADSLRRAMELGRVVDIVRDSKPSDLVTPGSDDVS